MIRTVLKYLKRVEWYLTLLRFLLHYTEDIHTHGEDSRDCFKFCGS